MTIARLQAAFSSALTRTTITSKDVDAFKKAVLDGGTATPEERAALHSLANQYRDRFDPQASVSLSALLASLDGPTPPASPASPTAPATPATPTVVSWDAFPVASSRATLGGTQKAEALATFDGLAQAVTKGELSPADQLLLASAASRVGVLGSAQALRAVDRLDALPAADRAAFGAVADAASSPLERAFLFKGLAAGHSVTELKDFEKAIHGWDAPKLLETLNLADPITDDGTQTGVKQQFRASCVATTGQSLFGELDPVYALAVRSENADVHAANDDDAFALNPKLAGEQKTLLEGHGGMATARNAWDGAGVAWADIDSLYNERSNLTGFTYSVVQLDEHPELTEAKGLDAVAAQLERGIPTPLLVGVEGAEKCHAMIALEVQGEGDAQRFLIHDPWAGDTTWVTRKEWLTHTAPLGDFKLMGGYHLASPAPLVATATPTPAPPPPAAPASPSTPAMPS